MPKFVLTYDVRSTNHDYAALYKLLADWHAAHLQNSVWLAELAGPASTVRDMMRSHMHHDDTIGVIQIGDPVCDWATTYARQPGIDWLKARFP